MRERLGSTSLEKPTVWFVSANGPHRGALMTALLSLYQVATFGTPAEAIQSTAPKPSVLIADELPAPRDGIGCILLLQESAALRGIPLIFMSTRDDPKLLEKVTHLGADWFLLKPYRRSALYEAVSTLANKAIEDGWKKLPEYPRVALQKSVEVYREFAIVAEGRQPLDFLSVMAACGPVLDATAAGQAGVILTGVNGHDNYPFAHSMRTATLLGLFAQAIGLPRDRQLVMASAGLMFDMGKLAIAPDILNKQGRITEGEMQVLRSHVGFSLKFLSATGEIPRNILTIAEQHHERLDGSGYPAGLSGSQINELARMAAIVDVYCGLTDNRVYKVGFTPERALAQMSGDMGAQLDQKMLALFKSRLLDSIGGGTKAAS